MTIASANTCLVTGYPFRLAEWRRLLAGFRLPAEVSRSGILELLSRRGSLENGRLDFPQDSSAPTCSVDIRRGEHVLRDDSGRRIATIRPTHLLRRFGPDGRVECLHPAETRFGWSPERWMNR